MPKFRVIIEENAAYECEITARSVADAERKGVALFLSEKGIAVGAPFSCDVREREVSAERVK